MARLNHVTLMEATKGYDV